MHKNPQIDKLQKFIFIEHKWQIQPSWSPNSSFWLLLSPSCLLYLLRLVWIIKPAASTVPVFVNAATTFTIRTTVLLAPRVSTVMVKLNALPIKTFVPTVINAALGLILPPGRNVPTMCGWTTHAALELPASHPETKSSVLLLLLPVPALTIAPNASVLLLGHFAATTCSTINLVPMARFARRSMVVPGVLRLKTGPLYRVYRVYHCVKKCSSRVKDKKEIILQHDWW